MYLYAAVYMYVYVWGLHVCVCVGECVGRGVMYVCGV